MSGIDSRGFCTYEPLSVQSLAVRNVFKTDSASEIPPEGEGWLLIDGGEGVS